MPDAPFLPPASYPPELRLRTRALMTGEMLFLRKFVLEFTGQFGYVGCFAK